MAILLTFEPVIGISIIGTGNVATQLANAIAKSPLLRLDCVYGRSEVKLESFKKITSTKTSLDNMQNTGLLVFAIQDDALKSMTDKIAVGDILTVHTSGSVSVNVFKKYERYGVFYPLQTFTAGREIDVEKIPFCLEAKNKKDLDILKNVAGALGANHYEVNSEQRAKLHLAAVYANNFVNSILAEAKKLSEKANLPFEILQPLVEETVKKGFELGPKNAQTGPARRGDHEVLKKQIDALDLDQKELYKTLTNSILKRYEREEL